MRVYWQHCASLNHMFRGENGDGNDVICLPSLAPSPTPLSRITDTHITPISHQFADTPREGRMQMNRTEGSNMAHGHARGHDHKNGPQRLSLGRIFGGVRESSATVGAVIRLTIVLRDLRGGEAS